MCDIVFCNRSTEQHKHMLVMKTIGMKVHGKIYCFCNRCVVSLGLFDRGHYNKLEVRHE